MNLVINAAEAINGGGQITITTRNSYIDRPIKGYDMVNEGDYVALSIEDTGIGISPEEMNRIFEPFYSKKKMGRSGTGLGMAVVWGAIKDHHGYIDSQSREGHGSRFTLYFPVTRKTLKKVRSMAVEEYMGHGETILVVDDIPEQLQIASAILEELGYKVVTVASGEKAVEYLKEHPADLLLLDMVMEPGMDGMDTYREVRNFKPDQKAIIASGFSETARIKEAQRLGVSHYIRKPYTMEKIGMMVRLSLYGE
jgi:CheY-like chemotaxis protein